ncbi:MAG: GDSL-type esterase/lipase family protein [Proteobacteria bacterium]|nr:GDSL-type esterase/lipase family protein [Pseudomonadota bacterium]
MKRPQILSRLLMLAFCLIFVGPIYGCSLRGHTLVCFGDGFTAGIGALPEQSWPSLLQKRIVLQELEIINLGYDGDTARNVSHRIKTDIIQHRPKMLIIFLGAGDIFPLGSVAAAYEQFPSVKTNFQNLVAGISDGVSEVQHDRPYYKFPKTYIVNTFGTTDTSAKVLHSALKRKDLFLQDGTDDFHAMLTVHGKMLEGFAQANGFDFIDNVWYGILDVTANISEDGIHPNANGYKVMEENIFVQLKPYIEKNYWVDGKMPIQTLLLILLGPIIFFMLIVFALYACIKIIQKFIQHITQRAPETYN